MLTPGPSPWRAHTSVSHYTKQVTQPQHSTLMLAKNIQLVFLLRMTHESSDAFGPDA